jgi:dTDP-4-dehydrorhamnose reductase
MRVAVVGARGQLGAAIVHEFGQRHDVLAFGRAELDIADDAAVDAAMDRARPEVIVDAAAFTNVDAAEDRPTAALDDNAFGVRALARAAMRHGATLVYYSTDFVFDGKTSSPYTETDRPNPQSIYAASKLLGEWFALEAPVAYVLRVESLFGRSESGPAPRGTIASILNTLTGGGFPKVFDDRTVSPTYLPDAVSATRRLLESGAPAGLYHCVNSGFCTWLEFAQALAHGLGGEALVARLVPVRMADVPLRAARPRFCALSNGKLASVGIEMPTWQDALARFLADERPYRADSLTRS